MTSAAELQAVRLSDQSTSKTTPVRSNRTKQIFYRFTGYFASKFTTKRNASAHKLSAVTSTDTDSMRRKIERNTLLSSLWLFTLLNIIFRDIHQLGKKSYLEELLATEVSEMLMFVAGFVIEIPISMVLLSLLLARRILRPITLVAALITSTGMLSLPPTDLDDVFFLTTQLLAMVAIAWTAWRWPLEEPLSTVGN